MDSVISVVIPTYKRSFEMLSRAVESVLSQTYNEIELIIVDDNHPDSEYRQEIEKEIFKLEDDKIRYIQHEMNMGACTARNTGIKHSSGAFIAFLDDDDEWESSKLKLQMEKMYDKNIGLVYCYSRTIYTDKNKTKIRSFEISGNVFKELLRENFIGSTSFPLIRKEAIEKCGGFNERLESSQDYDLWLRIAQKYQVTYVDRPLVNYYVHSGDRISSDIKKKIQGTRKLNKLYIKHLKEDSVAYVNRMIRLSSYYNRNKQYIHASFNYIKAMKFNPPYCMKVTYKIITQKNENHL